MAIATRPTDADVTAFLDAVPAARRRADGHAMRALMERVTGEPGVMWGPSMVGFGSKPYTTTAGTSEMFLLGFAPRAGALTVYGVFHDDAPADPLFEKLGPHTTGKSCLYLTRLDAVDPAVLEQLVRQGWQKANAD